VGHLISPVVRALCVQFEDGIMEAGDADGVHGYDLRLELTHVISGVGNRTEPTSVSTALGGRPLRWLSPPG
jgi:hypothetical protein